MVHSPVQFPMRNSCIAITISMHCKQLHVHRFNGGRGGGGGGGMEQAKIVPKGRYTTSADQSDPQSFNSRML